MYNQDANFDHLNKLLSSLHDADYYDYAYDWDGYASVEDELTNTLANNVDIAVQFINSLDFDDEVNVHIIKFIPKIVSKLKTIGEKIVLMNCLQTIQEKYPNLNLGESFFSTILDMGAQLGNGT